MMTATELGIILNAQPQQISRWRKLGMPTEGDGYELRAALIWLLCEREGKGRMPGIVRELEALRGMVGEESFWKCAGFWTAKVEGVAMLYRAKKDEGDHYERGTDPALDADLDRLDAWAKEQGIE